MSLWLLKKVYIAFIHAMSRFGKASPKDMMTENQSQFEIQSFLRQEVQALQASLTARFQEIATLTKLLEARESKGKPRADAVEPAADRRIAQLKRQHAIELVLLKFLYEVRMNGPIQTSPSFDRQVEIMAQSPLFSAEWYAAHYQDVAATGLSAAEHYLRMGSFQGKNPGPEFDTMGYYLVNIDTAEAGWPALLHYEVYGRAEGRRVTASRDGADEKASKATGGSAHDNKAGKAGKGGGKSPKRSADKTGA